MSYTKMSYTDKPCYYSVLPFGLFSSGTSYHHHIKTDEASHYDSPLAKLFFHFDSLFTNSETDSNRTNIVGKI